MCFLTFGPSGENVSQIGDPVLRVHVGNGDGALLPEHPGFQDAGGNPDLREVERAHADLLPHSRSAR